MDESWEQSRPPGPAHGHMLEPPDMHSAGPGRRSPSPSRILPQPQGAPVSTTVAEAMAREAAQRVAETSRLEKRSLFLERSSAGQYANSDEEAGCASPEVKRRGTSVDDFLKGSELGKQPRCCHGDDYHTESSQGSDLSDIMEEDEEELYSEMQLDDGGQRRPSGTSHNALKILGNPALMGRGDRMDHVSRRYSHSGGGPQRHRPAMAPSIEQHFLNQLQELGILTLTPARMVFGERIASHDDRFLLHLADQTGGIIVTNDNFREFVTESVSWREIITKRDMQPLLSVLPDVGMFDPSFRSPNTQVANTSHQPPSRNQGASSGPWLPQQPHFTPLATVPSMQQNLLVPAQRSSAETSELRAALLKIFPDSEQKLKIDQILIAHPYRKDLNALSALVLN